ncbi:hypothetical protein M885DRAFT_620949 [Pelagophyceae sp. CCMP2097]|nr:hypothetical protein M885DRAFT_620949 [Pelagophyceae sp. CCMP2097]
MLEPQGQAQEWALRGGLEREWQDWTHALDLAELAAIIGTTEARARALSAAGAIKPPPPPPMRCRVALITAARRKPTVFTKPRRLSVEDEPARGRRDDDGGRDDSGGLEAPPVRELLTIGGSESLICHALAGLERAGLTTVVVVVAHRGAEIMDHIRGKFAARQIALEFVDLGDDWNGTHAQSILSARTVVQRHAGAQPVLVATSDHLFDAALIRKLAASEDPRSLLLVEDELHRQCRAGMLPPTAVRVATRRREEAGFGARLRRWTAGPDDSETVACLRVGRGIAPHDAFDAGLARITGVVWGALEALEARRPRRYFALCDALDAAAKLDQLSAVFTEGLPWLAVETDEQLDFTRVVVTSPRFRDVAPYELLIARKKSSDALRQAAEQEAVPQARDDADEVWQRDAKEARPHVDEAVPLVAPGETRAFVAVAVAGARGGDAEAPRGPLRLRRSTTGVGPQLRVQLDGGCAPAHAAALVAVDDALFVVVDAAAPPPTAAQQLQRALLETAGVVSFDDVRSVELQFAAGSAGGGAPVLEARVARRVPVLGWCILVGATAAQASAALVLGGGGAQPAPLLLVLWRLCGATLLAVPAAAMRVKRTWGARRGSAKCAPPAAGATGTYNAIFACTSCFFISCFAFQKAVTAAAPDMLGDAVLFSSLTPLIIVGLRLVGAVGAPPTAGEMAGTALGVGGCAVCAATAAAAAPLAGAAAGGAGRLAAVAAFGFGAAFFHAGKVVVSADILANGFNASYLHLTLNTGAFFLALAVVVSLHPSILQTPALLNGNGGVFGLFAPKNFDAYLWLAFGVDTCGTFGYIVALQFVGPLVVTVAALMQPLCTVLEAHALLGDPLPGLPYAGGVALLLAGGTLVAIAGAATVEDVDISAAIKDRLQLKLEQQRHLDGFGAKDAAAPATSDEYNTFGVAA